MSTDDAASEAGALEFLAEFALDRQRGLDLPLLHYLGRFPGHEEAVAQEYLSLRQPAADRRDQIGPYRLLAELGRGGQGTVWLARDARVGRNVALKVLHEGLRSAISPERFQREAQLAARIDHPGINTVFDIGEDGGKLWLATRYVPGPSLATLIARARQQAGDERRCLRLPGVPADADDPTCARAVLIAFEAVARALHAAHLAGVVHRDVKPGNILMPPQGPPVLVDFGLARAIAAGTAGAVTQAGELLGTPAYMAPERLQAGDSDPGPTVDSWALAVALYECLTLQLPYAGSTSAELDAAFHRLPPPLPPLGRLSRDLDVVLAAALARDPHDRYRDAAAFAEDLRRTSLGLPPQVRRPGPLLRALRFCSVHPGLCAAAGLVLVGLVLALVVVEGMRQQADAATAVATARAADLRRLSRRLVLDLHSAVRELPGATEVSQQLLGAGLEYLELLQKEAGDEELGALLRDDVALTHLLVGDVLGSPRQANLGRPAEARQHYDLALALLPAARDAGYALLRGQCLLRLGELDLRESAPALALNGWQQALDLLAQAPATAPLALLQAQLHLRFGEVQGPVDPAGAFAALDRAQGCLERVRGAEPDLVDLDLWNATAWLVRARLQLDLGWRADAAASVAAADQLLLELPLLHDHERRAHRLRIATDALLAVTAGDPDSGAVLMASAAEASSALLNVDPRDEEAARLELLCLYDRAHLALRAGDVALAMRLRAAAREAAAHGRAAFGPEWAREPLRSCDQSLGLCAARLGVPVAAAGLFAAALGQLPAHTGDAHLAAIGSGLRWRLLQAMLALR